MSLNLSIKLSEITQVSELETDWLELQKTADYSFFTSWSWVKTWISLLPDASKLTLIQVYSAKKIIALGVISKKRNVRNKLFQSKGFYLHETGDLKYDQLTIEYNDLLVNKDYKNEVWEFLLNKINSNNLDWNEFYVSGSENISNFEKITTKHQKIDLVVRDEMPIYWADLTELGDSVDDYLQSLSSNTRYQIRRSIRKYEENGEISIQSASTVAQALEYLANLKELHQKYWTGKGHAGAFANPIFEKFHENLIKECLPKSEIQLLEISHGENVIGFLYNFILDGRVYSYQSGLNYSQDKKLKPGLVCHYLAIKHNFELGRNIYDFLAGESQYKKSLSNANAKLYWLVLQKKCFTFYLEKNLKHLKSKISSS